MVSQTSLEAYDQIIESGTEYTQQEIIQKLIKKVGGLTRRQISKITGLEMGAVAGRVNSLVNQGLLIEEDTTVCEYTHRRVKLVTHVEKQGTFQW